MVAVAERRRSHESCRRRPAVSPSSVGHGRPVVFPTPFFRVPSRGLDTNICSYHAGERSGESRALAGRRPRPARVVPALRALAHTASAPLFPSVRLTWCRMSFVHLHVHTNFSFGDGAGRIDELVGAAQRLGMPALAITDHDGLYGAVRFYQACKAAGVKPIVGVEISVESVLAPPAVSAETADGGDPASVPRAPGSLAPGRGAAGETAAAAAAALGAATSTAANEGASPTTAEPAAAGPGMRANSERECYPRRQPRVPYSGSRSASPTPGPASAGGAAAIVAAAVAAADAPVATGAAEDARVPRVSTTDLSPSPPPRPVRQRRLPPRAAGPRLPGLVAALPHHQRRPPRAPRRTAARPLRDPRRQPRPPHRPVGLPARRGGRPPARRRRGRRPPRRAPLAAALRPQRLLHRAHDELLPDSAGCCAASTCWPASCACPRSPPTTSTTSPRPTRRCTTSSPPRPPTSRCPTRSGARNSRALPQDPRPDVAPLPPLPRGLPQRRAHRRALQPRPGPGPAPLSRLPAAARRDGLLAALQALLRRRRRALQPGHPRGARPPQPRAQGDPGARLRRVLPGRARHRPVRPRARHLLLGARLGRQQHRQLRAAHHRRRPHRHNLLFERFLNPNRREMPDIDIDFDSARRDEVIDYIYERFGHDNVAMVANVNTMRAPSAVRIVAKALDFAPTRSTPWPSTCPGAAPPACREMLAERPELANHEFQQPALQAPRRPGRAPRRLPLHLGTHLGGFVSRRPHHRLRAAAVGGQGRGGRPVQQGRRRGARPGQDGHPRPAHPLRRRRGGAAHPARTGERIAAWELPPDDPAAYEIISKARSIGLFQLESSGQRNLATRLQERDFDDVIAAIALFRPGPLEAEMIGPFIPPLAASSRPSCRTPPWPALAGTYGVILYQEQVFGWPRSWPASTSPRPTCCAAP